MKFYVVPWFGLAGVLLSVVFLPDTTGLDLKEQERRWAFIRAGRGHEYHGVAVHPKHLSLWERIRGLGKQYDADLDYSQRVEEMRKEWEVLMQEKADEKASHLNEADWEELDHEFTHEVQNYFKKTTKSSTLQNVDRGSPLMSTDSKTEDSEDSINEKRAV